MHPLFITLLFNESLIQALCLTLVHSLWQGLLLALVTGLLVLLTRKSTAVVRYGLFSVAFVLFLLGSVYTFIVQWDHAEMSAVPPNTNVAEALPPMSVTGEKAVFQVGFLTGHPNVVESAAAFFNKHAYLIVLIWFVILVVKMVRVTIQFGAGRKLARHRVRPPSQAWKDRARELASRIGITIPVTLLESEVVTVPMMMGFLKPIILLPVSLLAQLPPAEVEAILLHELAHIRRGDYFVNIIFTFWEMLFFFNPAVLWICALIREERENCCDDIAIRQVGSKKEFVSALVSFVQCDRKAEVSAMFFPGSGNHLLKRVRRIVYRDDKQLDGKEKFFLVFCFVLAGIVGLAYTHASPAQRRPGLGVTAAQTKDSVPNGHPDTLEKREEERVAPFAADSVRLVAKTAKEGKTRIKAEKTQRKELEKQEVKERKELKEMKEKEGIEERREPNERADMDERKERTEMKEKEEKKEIKERDELKEMKEPKEKKEMKETALKEMKVRDEIRELRERMGGAEVNEQSQSQEAKERAEQQEMKRQRTILKKKIDAETRKIDEEKGQVDDGKRKVDEEKGNLIEEKRRIDSLAKKQTDH
jgi:bla regulator protein blaR1